MQFRHLYRLTAVPFVLALWLAGAPAVYADEPTQGVGTDTISLSPVVERLADGNVFIDYTFTENFAGLVSGTRVGSGELVIHADGTLNTQNSGVFTGTIAGRSGTAVMEFWGTGTFASATGNLTGGHGTGGLDGVHLVAKVSGSATGPTSLAGTETFKVTFSAA
ncbi:MAG TPA: hypothetical protein VFL29_04075 [Candidatus Dormibacteraeota bacterium]|nr:hypothetical protein [Candidatus Dormibacteraeota bacterium]